MQVAFVENKDFDPQRIAALLEACRDVNQWANRGPLYRRLADAYAAHLNLDESRTVTPCANAGLALEALARLQQQIHGRKLRWVASAFSFKNVGRGHFADAEIVDCDAMGVLDLAALTGLDPESYDGILLVNPQGLMTGFDAILDFATRAGKTVLIDNAAGLNHAVPDWPWQVFSLHHTKPYGFGEGGLALTPAEHAEDLYALFDYGDVPVEPGLWLNNAKLSDVSCAFHLDRLERVSDWAPRYGEQRDRVVKIAAGLGLRPLALGPDTPPTTSVPFLAPRPISRDVLHSAPRRMTMAKYYDPLRPCPIACELFEHLLNVPTHPDMARLSDRQIAEDLRACLD